VNDLLDLQQCSVGVATAMQNEDYEQAAAHVHRFLTMDENLLKHTAVDVSEGELSYYFKRQQDQYSIRFGIIELFIVPFA
jgi:hypothetical protein